MARTRKTKNTQNGKLVDISPSLETEIKRVLDAARAAAEAAFASADVLLKVVRLRGTKDVAEAARRLKPKNGTIEPLKRGRPSPDGGALYRTLEAMLRERPMTFREILVATGEVNPNRIKGAITAFQREGLRVVNLGTKGRARWYIQS